MFLENQHNQVLTDVEIKPTDNHWGLILRNCTNIQIRGAHNLKNSRGILVEGNKSFGNVIECASINARGVGIFISRFVQRTTIQNCDIEAGRTGIYLESGSHHNEVINNYIHNCGYYYDPRTDETQLPFRMKRLGYDKREGIAVDDSRYNTIDTNLITNCAAGGIFLYRNCGEHGTYVRGEGANYNKVTHNILKNMDVGIWNASRQFRDMRNWECLCPSRKVRIKDLPIHMPYQQWFDWTAFSYMIELKKWLNPFRRHIDLVQDFAFNNEFEDNKYINVKYNFLDHSAWSYYER